MKVALAKPEILQEDIDAVLAVMHTNQLSIGPQIERFEEYIREVAGTRHAVAVNSGTSALHLVVRAMGLQDGDEVITTPFSFVASSNCLLYERVRPVFVDIDPQTLNIDSNRIEAAITPRTRAILPVHAFGRPADMDPIRSVAKKYGLQIIEDSCEALGARYKGRPAGSLGDAGVFAFYPNKQITTGEGGVIVTDNDEIASLCRSMRNQGRGEGDRWLFHERLGYNYRLDELSAALGASQILRLNSILAARDDVARRYGRRLAGIRGVKAPQVSEDVVVSWFVYVVQLDQGINRDSVMRLLEEHGVGCRPYFPAIHLQPFFRSMFGYKEGDYPITEGVASRTLAIPFFNSITDEEIDYVANELERAIAHA